MNVEKLIKFIDLHRDLLDPDNIFHPADHDIKDQWRNFLNEIHESTLSLSLQATGSKQRQIFIVAMDVSFLLADSKIIMEDYLRRAIRRHHINEGMGTFDGLPFPVFDVKRVHFDFNKYDGDNLGDLVLMIAELGNIINPLVDRMRNDPQISNYEL